MMHDYQIVDEINEILNHFEVNTMHSSRKRLEHRLFEFVKEAMRSAGGDSDVCSICTINDVTTFCVLCSSGGHGRDEHRLSWHNSGHR